MEQKLDDFLALKSLTKAEAKFEIGGKTYLMKPLVIKKYRQLLQILNETQENFKVNIDDMDIMINMILTKIVALFPIVFDAEISQEFADNNISYPLCKEIWETFVKLNGIEGMIPFFQKAVKIRTEVQTQVKS